MINSIEAYKEAGLRAGTAMRQRDVGRYDHEKRWLSAAKAMEKEEYRQAVQAAWEEGYRDGNPPRAPEYFR